MAKQYTAATEDAGNVHPRRRSSVSRKSKRTDFVVVPSRKKSAHENARCKTPSVAGTERHKEEGCEEGAIGGAVNGIYAKHKVRPPRPKSMLYSGDQWIKGNMHT